MALRDRRGFTITELLLAAAAAGMISVVSASLLMRVIRFNSQVTARATVTRDARASLQVLEQELAQARGHTVVIDRYDASQPPYSQATFTTVDGRAVTYYQRGSRLYRRRGPSTSVVATGLRQVVFTYPMSDATGLLSLAVTFERAAGDGGTKTLELSSVKVKVQNADSF
jgi:type II secretory pathway pseudopilin PulG